MGLRLTRGRLTLDYVGMPALLAVPPVDFQLVRINSLTSRVAMLAVDDDGVPVVPTSVTVTISNGDDEESLYTEDTITPPATPRIIAGTGDGAYYIVLGTISTDADEETDGTYGTLFVTWTVDFGADGVIEKTVSISVVQLQVFRLISQLRNMVDKAILPIDTDPLNPMFTGYTDAQLFEHLNHGLSTINWYGPPVTWTALTEFPGEHYSVLIEAAMYAALLSQTTFAISTELDSYSDLGGSWMVSRSPKLQQMLQMIVARLDITVPKLKKLYYTPGGIYRQVSHRGSVVSLAMPGANGINFLNTWGGSR